MTTLIIDFNTKAVYADSRTTKSQDGNETIRFDDSALKIFNIEGKILAGVGCAEVLSKVRDNLLLSNNFNFIPKTKREATIYLVSKKGDAIEVEEYTTKKKSWLTGYYSWSRVYRQLTTKDSWITAGSGEDYAAGALKQGATPEEAIVVASMLDEFTNNIVQKIKL